MVLELLELSLVDTGVGRREGLLIDGEGVTAAKDESTCVFREFVPNRPRGVGAESIAPGEVEPIYGPDRAQGTHR